MNRLAVGIFVGLAGSVGVPSPAVLAQQAQPSSAPKTALEMQITERKGQIEIYEAAAKEAASRSEAAKALADSSRADLAKLEAQLPKPAAPPISTGHPGSTVVHPAQPGSYAPPASQRR